jgi:di/tricarboxylate transporter
MGIWIVTIILIATMYLLISERISMDLTAITIMVALMISGILTPAEAVAGFSNPATRYWIGPGGAPGRRFCWCWLW